jgi:hypothetical protein
VKKEGRETVGYNKGVDEGSRRGKGEMVETQVGSISIENLKSKKNRKENKVKIKS